MEKWRSIFNAEQESDIFETIESKGTLGAFRCIFLPGGTIFCNDYRVVVGRHL